MCRGGFLPLSLYAVLSRASGRNVNLDEPPESCSSLCSRAGALLCLTTSPITPGDWKITSRMSSLDEKERAGAPPGTCDAHFDSDSSSSSAGQGRTSTDVRQRDHETLTAEEEVEQLLSEKSRAATGFFGRLFQRADAPTDDVRNLKRVRRRGKKRRRRERQGEEDRLIYNVEEGGPTSDVTSSASSSEVDMGSKSMGGKRKVSGRARILRQSVG